MNWQSNLDILETVGTDDDIVATCHKQALKRVIELETKFTAIEAFAREYQAAAWARDVLKILEGEAK